MPLQYSSHHLSDIHYIYGYCDGNARRAVVEYRRRFPNRRTPHHSTFTAVHRQFNERGLRPLRPERALINLDLHTENRIMNLIIEDPTLSSRAVSRIVHVNYRVVLRVWKRYGLRPYHLRKVQGLLPADGLARVAYCQRINQKLVEDADFLKKILWTDEACFTREGIFNSHNMHMWCEENPYAKWVYTHQHKFSVNLWAGIIGDVLIGPIVFPQRLNSENYLNFLRNDLNILLEDIDLQTRNTMWFQHDGAPPHFGLQVRNWLNRAYPNRWIGRGSEAIAWPPRSPDLTPLDFFFWGALKDKVYARPIDSREELLQRIMAASDEIRNSNFLLSRQYRVRIALCIDNNGLHFENFMQ